MAQSHHREKHKGHLEAFKNTQSGTGIPKRARSSGAHVFAIAGMIFGLGVTYLLISSSLTWMVIVGALFASIGYYIGWRIDKGKVN